jgi:hypothetical protein
MKIFYPLKFVLIFSVIMAFSSVSGCAFSCFNTKFDAADFLMSRPHQPDGSSQVLLVQRCGFWIFTRTIVYVMEQREGNWSAVSPPMDAVIGRNGFAPPGEKREGDGKTPSGIFPWSWRLVMLTLQTRKCSIAKSKKMISGLTIPKRQIITAGQSNP